ncbi:MAG TPA: glycosyltransferase [Xanthobacteraceae bacterium]|nr:glycosyltransferase [Xanthobacteraceae bacterium]
MKIVVFGLTISSSWGNGHATLWRGLCRALARHGHRVVFFERDVPYYAMNRDLFAVPGGELILYSEWAEIRAKAQDEITDADASIVTSYCPDGVAATELVSGATRAVRVFYDLDSPVTLSRLSRGERVAYLGVRGLADFDLVLSFTGGAALDELQHRLGARTVMPLYGHVDPEVHRRVASVAHYHADLSYLGTHSVDRQAALSELLIEPARRCPQHRFLIGGAQYPQDFPWAPNIFFVRHLPPSEHRAFFSSSRLTLNVTREPMARMGWCPSGRLFEAAACGTAILSDTWEGLETFFLPGEEIFATRGSDDVIAALDLDEAEIKRVGEAARERTLSEHTSERRSFELVAALEKARSAQPQLAGA